MFEDCKFQTLQILRRPWNEPRQSTIASCPWQRNYGNLQLPQKSDLPFFANPHKPVQGGACGRTVGNEKEEWENSNCQLDKSANLTKMATDELRIAECLVGCQPPNDKIRLFFTQHIVYHNNRTESNRPSNQPK